MVQHDIGIALVACCEHDDLELFRQLFQQLVTMRPDIHPGIDLLPGGELDLQTDIIRRLDTLITMDQRLIKIQHHRVFMLLLMVDGQRHRVFL